MPKTSVFCKTNHALKSVLYKTNHACNKQFPQDKPCPENRSSAIKFTPTCFRFPGDCSYPYIPFQSSASFARRFIPDSPMFCSTNHTHALQSSARPFKPRFSCLVDRFLYSAILRSRADILRSRVFLHDSVACYSAFLNIHRSSVLTALTWLVPHESAAASALSVYTIEPCTMSLHAKTQSSARPFILIRSRLLQDSSYPYSPDFCKTVHTHTLQISARQFIHIHSRRLQDNSYPYNPDFCRTFHTHTLQTSARQFIPIHSRLLQDSSFPYTPDL